VENLTQIYSRLRNSERINCSKEKCKEMKALEGAGFCKQGELKRAGEIMARVNNGSKLLPEYTVSHLRR
jgi:hypothetical protein